MWNSMGKADLIRIDHHFLIAESQFDTGVAFQQQGRGELEFQHFKFVSSQQFVCLVSGLQGQQSSRKFDFFLFPGT